MAHLPILRIASCLLLLALACGKSEPAPEPSAAAAPPPQVAAAPPPTEAVPAAEAAPGFEGEATLRVVSAKKGSEPALIAIHVKGKQLRFALPEGLQGEGERELGKKAHLVIDGAAKKVLMISDDKRTAMVLPIDKLGEQMAQLRAAAPAGQPAAPQADAKPEITKTGKTDTVAGRACEEWEIAQQDQTTLRVCVASEATAWLELPALGLPGEHAWARGLLDGKHLPLRAIAFEGGKEKGRVELVKLEPKPVDAALFAPPEGYRVVDMAQMMAGMSEMMKGMTGAMPAGGSGGGEVPGAMPPGMAGKLPPNFHEMMQRMRAQMQQMKAQQGTQPEGAHRADGVEQLAAPAKPAAKAEAKAKAKASAATKPAAKAE